MADNGAKYDSSKMAYLHQELLHRMQYTPDLFDCFQKATVDGIWYRDLENINTMWISPGFKRLFGYAADEIENGATWWYDNIFPDDEKASHHALQDHLTHGKPYTLTVRYHHKNGSTVWVRCHGRALFNKQGKPVRMLAAIIDLTPLVKLQEELKAKEDALDLFYTTPSDGFEDCLKMNGAGKYLIPEFCKTSNSDAFDRKLENAVEQRNALCAHTHVSCLKEAEESMEINSTILAIMSHEVKTPLNAVLGMSQVLGETHLSQEQRDCLATLYQSGKHLLSLINHVLEFSQIHAGHISLAKLEFQIQDVVRDIVDTWHGEAQKKQVALTFEASLSSAFTFMGDEERSRQVVYQIVGNAVKFTNEGGTISVAMESVQVEGYPGVRIDVHDNGVGMSPAEQMHIFDHFTHASIEIRNQYGGCGLGLSICKKLVVAMGGKIDVSSQLGSGSTFSLWLPGMVAPTSVCQALSKSGENEVILYQGVDLCHQNRTDSLASAMEAAGRTTLMRPSVSRGFIELNSAPNALCDSNSDKGSMCRLPHLSSLQQACSPKRHGMSCPTAWPMHRVLRVLVVDDNTINIKLMQKMLVRFSCNVEVAVNGLEAITLARHSCWDMILMDLVMPEMDGFVATQHIREQDAGVYIVALTANATKDDRDKCRQVGMNDFLTKPICLGELSRVMHDALEKSGQLRGKKQTGCWTIHDQLGMLSMDCDNK